MHAPDSGSGALVLSRPLGQARLNPAQVRYAWPLSRLADTEAAKLPKTAAIVLFSYLQGSRCC
jgi:hypothetical protein